MTGPTPILELRELDVPFGTESGLRRISLTVEPGERVVLVGASGAGKSSLLGAVAGSRPWRGGEIWIGGRSVSVSEPAPREVILLDQRPLLFPHLSVRENVAFPAEVRGVEGAELYRRVADLLELLRIAPLAERRPASLSGGQAHRVALARAMAAAPALLLLDEPFTGLDPELRRELQTTVARVAERFGAALLMVTHDLQEAGRVGERVGVLVDRRLARLAPPAELFREPGSVAVARFIGWPNLLPVAALPTGVRTALAGVPGMSAAEGAPPAERLRLCFGPDGARLLPRGGGSPPELALPVRVLAVEHHPNGATARWAAEWDDSGGEVAVDASTPPSPDEPLHLQLHPDRVRIYPTSETTR